MIRTLGIAFAVAFTVAAFPLAILATLWIAATYVVPIAACLVRDVWREAVS